MCTNPLRGWINSKGSVFKVTKSNVEAITFYDDVFIKYYNKDDIPKDLSNYVYTDYIDIPCRSCLACYNDMRRAWISRAVAEAQLHDSMIFCTFTYNDDHVPVSEFVDDDGVYWSHQTLCYRDFQLFMKRLRKHFSDKKLRYMVCGEYGSTTFRPHYHAIIYGLSLLDLELCIPHTKNAHGDTLYTNSLLDGLWKKGYILIGDANVSTISYVAGYVAKKADTVQGKQFYKIANIMPPFIKASNRPGLGSLWFEENLDKFDDVYDYHSLSCAESEPTRIYLTQSWKNKYERALFEDTAWLGYLTYCEEKDKRRVDFIDNKYQLLNTDMTKDDYNNSLNTHLRNSSKRKRGTY